MTRFIQRKASHKKGSSSWDLKVIEITHGDTSEASDRFQSNGVGLND